MDANGLIQTGGLSSALTVLSAMITPAVLISACGSLLIATSNRLIRVVDRTRELSDKFTELTRVPEDTEFLDEQRSMLFDQLNKATFRARMLQRSMTRLYSALGVFVATSVAIGVVALSGVRYAWIPILLGLSGAALLFWASVLLIIESRVALVAINSEMDFVWKLGQRHAPSELRRMHRVPRRFRRAR